MRPVFQRSLLVFLLFGSPAFGATNQTLGATVNKNGTNVTGVTFRVWAPNATNVVVRGQFNHWADLAMTKDSATGYWTATNSAARPGQEYKYALRVAGDSNERWKHDPRTTWVRNGNSVIYDHSAFDWGEHNRPAVPVDQKVIYEMHIGTFYDPDPADGRPGTFDDAISRLDYLQRLGVNVIALMPVNEFGGEFSWGYNPEHLFAIEAAYGGPDGLKRFVRAAHSKGIKVQLDAVHNHWNPPVDGLWEFDGTNDIYFYGNEPLGWTAWGRRPNYSQPEVRRFILDNARMLLDEFRIDGFRWDSPQNFVGYDSHAPDDRNAGNPQTVIGDGKSLMMEINRMIHRDYPDARWSIAEDADLLTVRPQGSWYAPGSFQDLLRVDDAADSFDGHWQTSFHNTITAELEKTNPNVVLIQGKVTEWSEPPGYRVVFTDNHDKSGDLNGARRLANRMVPSDPAGKIARKKTLLNAVLTLTAPGAPMLWMGQEFHATGTFSSGTFDRNARLNWREASAQHRVYRAHRDLVEMRRSLPALRDSDLDASTGFVNDDHDLMAYWRLGTNNEANVVVLFNLSAEDVTISCPFPSTGAWHVQFNSDWNVYGADFANFGPTGNSITANSGDGGFVRGTVPVAAHSVVILARTQAPAARLAEDANSNGLADGWESVMGVSNPEADNDLDGLSNLFEYRNGLDPLERDAASVSFNSLTGPMRASSDNPVVQHIAWAVDPVTVVRPSSFSFLANTNIPGPFFTNPAGAYLRFALNLTDLTSGYFVFAPNTNLAVVDTNRTNWAAFHGVTDFGANPDGDAFSNLQEFARGSDPNSPNRSVICLAGHFNGWNESANPMAFAGATRWVSHIPGSQGTTGEFKFTAGKWSTNWGENLPADFIADLGGANVVAQFSNGNGMYRVSFDEGTSAYTISRDATDANADGIQDAWTAFYGLTGDNAAANADPDGDGWSNLAEFVRFTNADGGFMSPIVSDSAVSPKRMTVTGGTLPLPSWQPNANNMTWSDQRMRWEWTGVFSNTTNLEFKFSQATNHANWSGGDSWGWGIGNSNQGVAVRNGPGNIIAPVTNGTRYRIAFHDLTGAYSFSSYPVSTEWWETNGLPEPLPSGNPDPRWDEDPDGDGFTRRLEYALGGSPTAPDRKGLTAHWLTNTAGTNRLVLQWLQRTNGGSSLSIAPMVSTSLGATNTGWATNGVTVTTNVSQMNVPAGLQRREGSVPMDGAAKFLRLRVTGP